MVGLPRLGCSPVNVILFAALFGRERVSVLLGTTIHLVDFYQYLFLGGAFCSLIGLGVLWFVTSSNAIVGSSLKSLGSNSCGARGAGQ